MPDLKIGDKVFISESMKDTLYAKCLEDNRFLDYFQKENMYGRADFSGRTGTITKIEEKSTRNYYNPDRPMRLKYQVSCSKEQWFDVEFLTLYVKPTTGNMTFKNGIITDCEGDTLTITEEERETLIKTNLNESFGDIEVLNYGGKYYINKNGNIIQLLKKDLKCLK